MNLLLAITLALIITVLFWPEKIHPAAKHYLDFLSLSEWKEEGEIYEKILGQYPFLTPNEHNRILLKLHAWRLVEQHIPPARDIEEIMSLNRFGDMVYKDHIEPFCTIQSVLYKKRARGPGGGRRVWHKIIRHAFA